MLYSTAAIIPVWFEVALWGYPSSKDERLLFEKEDNIDFGLKVSDLIKEEG